MFIARATSLLELLGAALISAAVALGVYERAGLVVALLVGGLLAFGWSFLFGAVHREDPLVEEAP